MIPLFKVHMPTVEVMEPLRQTFDSGYLTEGPRVKEFEAALKKFLGATGHVLATNSCTSALHLAYRLAGVGPGTVVLAPPVSCIATYAPLLELGAEIVWCDVRSAWGSLDTQTAEEMLERDPRIRVAVAVHWGGVPVHGLQRFWEACKTHGVKLVVDAAHAFGAEAHEQAPGGDWDRDDETFKVANVGDYVCYSFQAIRHITTLGDGGALVVNGPDWYRAKKLRWFGIDRDRSLSMTATRA